jgi:hypothetical protein
VEGKDRKEMLKNQGKPKKYCRKTTNGKRGKRLGKTEEKSPTETVIWFSLVSVFPVFSS